eukprot:Stramenopile-MAST_4_protein_136
MVKVFVFLALAALLAAVPATRAGILDEVDDDEGVTLKMAHDYCIVGAGPAGLQMAHHMAKAKNDFILFERVRPGVKFETQPVHRELISINKRFTSRANPVFNERHDWNSILSDDKDMVMGKYSKKYYPHADTYVKYLRDYSDMLERQVRDGYDNSTTVRVVYGADVVRLRRTEETVTETQADGTTTTVKKSSSTSTAPLVLDVALSEEAAGKYYHNPAVEGLEVTCKDLVWATGFVQNPIDEIPGYDLPGVERYIDVDASNERYENETVLIVGNGNAGLETAKALANTAGKVTIVFRSPLKFAWRSHYVGNARSVNLDFVDGYLLKSLDLLDSYPCPTEGIYIQQKNNSFNPYTGRPVLEYRCSMAEKMAEMQGQKQDTPDTNEDGTEDDLSQAPEFLTENRLAAETNRFHNQGFDRIIFATGFRFDADARIFRDVTVRPKVDANHKFPVMDADYQSTNVPGMYFAGALSHGRDYRRGAGGFIHGFRYTARSLFHILQAKKHGPSGWPSHPMTKEEVANGTHTYRRVNEMAGPYQMFAELCDLLVFSDGEQCRPDTELDANEPYARYYEEVPLSYAHTFVRTILKKLRFIAICYDYGHGKFSDMSPFSADYIGKRQGPIYRALGVGGNSPNEELQSFNFGMGLKATVKNLQPPHHDQGTTGGGLDSNFLHPILAYYELHNTKSYSRIEQRSMRDKLRAKAILYPVANHHMLEDVETMFDLFFTHQLPMTWWLRDRVDCVGAPRARWLNAKGNPKVRVPRKLDEIHVELMGRDYEVARYNVRQQEAQMEGHPFHFSAPENNKGSIFRKGYDSGQGGPQDESDPSGDDLPTSRNGNADAMRKRGMRSMGAQGPGMMQGQQQPGQHQPGGGMGGMPGGGMGGGMPGGGMGGGMPGGGMGGMPGGGMGGGMPGGGMGGMPGGGMGGMPGGGMGGMPGGGMGGGMPGGGMGGMPGGGMGGMPGGGMGGMPGGGMGGMPGGGMGGGMPGGGMGGMPGGGMGGMPGGGMGGMPGGGMGGMPGGGMGGMPGGGMGGNPMMGGMGMPQGGGGLGQQGNGMGSRKPAASNSAPKKASGGGNDLEWM